MSLWCFLIFLVRLKEVETFNMDFKGYSPSTMRSALEKNGEEIVMQVLDQVPDWMKELFLFYQGATLELVHLYKPELIMLCIVLGTMAAMHVLSRCFDRKKWEIPLVKKIAEMDRKLFVANNELYILQRELVDTQESSKKEGEMIVQLSAQYDTLRKELQTSKESVDVKERELLSVNELLEDQITKISTIKHDVDENNKKIEDLADLNRVGSENLREKESLIVNLQNEVECIKDLMIKKELQINSEINEKEIVIKEVEAAQKMLHEMKIDYEMATRELVNSNTAVDNLRVKLVEMEETEENLRISSEFLQSQLDVKSEEYDKLESEVSCLKSRITVIEHDCQSKECEIEVLKEALEEELLNKNGDFAEADGWDLDGDCFTSVELEEVKEQAKLRIKSKRYEEENEKLVKKLEELKIDYDELEMQRNKVEDEIKELSQSKDNAIKTRVEAERKLDILNDYFNKKEEELRLKLGQETSKYKSVASDAELATRRFASLSNELEQTRSQVSMLTKELEEQETSLKQAYMEAEKKSEENWIAARKAERKVTEMQKEMSSMRNKITTMEANKEIVTSSTTTQNSLSSGLSSLPPLPALPALPGMSSLQSFIPPALPSLPGLSLPPLIPGLAPGQSSLHQMALNDTIANISFASRRTQSMSSLSPDQTRDRPSQSQDSYDHYKDRSVQSNNNYDRYKDRRGGYDRYKNSTLTRSPSPPPLESTRSGYWGSSSTARKRSPSIGGYISHHNQYKTRSQVQNRSMYDFCSPPDTDTSLSMYGGYRHGYSYPEQSDTSLADHGPGYSSAHQVDGCRVRV